MISVLVSEISPQSNNSHTVNLLSALPLRCLDVLLTVREEPDSTGTPGVNMECVNTLVLFMERRLESVSDEVETFARSDSPPGAKSPERKSSFACVDSSG